MLGMTGRKKPAQSTRRTQQARTQRRVVYRTAYQAAKFSTIAHHEAGHAVFCLLMDLPFVRVEIFPDRHPTPPDGTVLGNVISDRGWPLWACPGTAEYKPRQAREYFKRDVCMTLAGPLAETLHTRCWKELPMNEGDDEFVAYELASELYPQRGTRFNWLNTLRFQTLEMLHHPLVWQSVEAVADAIFRFRTLTCGQVQQLVRQTCQQNGCSFTELQAKARRAQRAASFLVV
jgi:hypothetical protein